MSNGSQDINEYFDERQNIPDKPVNIKPSNIEEDNVGIQRQQENTRSFLSRLLLQSLLATAFVTGVYIIVDSSNSGQIDKEKRDVHRELITLIWSSQVTLAGSALGFYFGSEQKK